MPDPNDINANLAALSPQVTGAGGIAPIGALTPEQIVAANELAAREEEARAFNAMALRNDPAALAASRAAQTHAPTDGSGGVPAIPVMPPAASTAPVAPVLTPPAVAPVAARPARPAAPAAPAAPSAMSTANAGIAAADAAQATAMEEVSAEEQVQLQAQADIMKRQKDDQDAERRLQSLDRQEAEQRITEAREKASSKKIKGFFEDSTITQDIATGISIMLGSVSFSDNHTNQAVQIIDRAMARYAERQEKEKADLWKNVDIQLQQGQQLRQDQIREMADFRINQAMALEQVITQSKAAMSKTRNKEAIRAFEANNKRLEFQREHLLDDGRRLWSMSNETKRHNIATEGIARTAASAKENAQTGEKTAVYDEANKLIGHVTGGKGGAQAFMTRDADYARGEHTLRALLEDIKQNGARVFLPEAVKRRNYLYKNAVIGVATVSPLGKTDEAQHLEAASIGNSGAYTKFGATPEAVAKKIHELQNQRTQYRNQGLIGYSGPAAEATGHAASATGNDKHSAASGQIEPGNIDLKNRPRVKNADGSVSTVRSLGVNIDGKEILIPTVSEDGRIMTDDEAVKQYKKTGRHLGKFSSVAAANSYAEQLHNDQAKMVDLPSGYTDTGRTSGGKPVYKTPDGKLVVAQ